MWVILAALGCQRGRCVIAPPGLERECVMTWSPEFQRADRAGGTPEVRLGHPVIDLSLPR